MKRSDTLTVKEIEKLARQPGVHRVSKNLILESRGVSASWTGRHQISGRTWWPGYGAYPEVTLATALEKRDADRKRIRNGFDPWEERDAERAAKRESERPRKNFRLFAQSYITDHEAIWNNPTHRKQWPASLRAHVYPAIGALWMDEITTEDAVNLLRPIWYKVPETARRVRGRCEAIWAAGKVLGYCSGDNPFRLDGNIKLLLPRERNQKSKAGHHAALPWQEIPQFMADLSARDGTAARALEFLILCWVRTGDIIGQKGRDEDRPPMRWEHVDLEAQLWTIPGTKTGGQHRVPLSDAAVQVLRSVRGLDPEIVFPSPGKQGQPLSNNAMLTVLKRMGRTDVTTHGFRSSAKDWASETTSFPREVTEMALAHEIESDVEAAYRRGDLFVKRRHLMAAWADYCGNSPADVIPLHPAVAS
jgi:integrase